MLLGRTFAKVEAAAAEIGERAMPVDCDVASPASVKAAFAEIARRHEKIDVLINNAAVFEPSPIAEASDEHIMKTLAINLGGTILCSRAAIPMMGRGGHIINVSSESVETLHMPHLLVYQCSKAAVERFSQGLDRELESSGIGVSVVRAGAMMEPGKVWNIPPEVRISFGKAAMAAGINLRDRPISEFTSVTGIFRTLIDMPADLRAGMVALHARRRD